jgi:photosystem II stability/assembly factor-like uncharacterized protein
MIKMKNLYILILVLILHETPIFAQSGWQSQPSGTSNWLHSAYFTSSSTGWIVGANGIILKTTNGGDNWTSQASGTNEYFYALYFTSSSTGWTVGSGGIILKTTNGGDNWIPQSNGTGFLSSVHFTNPTTGWAVGDSILGEVILKTTNGGDNWVSQSSGITGSLSSVYFRNSSTGWAVGGYETSDIITTTNGGENWTSQSSGTTQSLRSVFFRPSSSTGWIVGHNGTILKTTNSGVNWISQSSGITNAAFYSVYFTSLTTGWAVAQFGIIVKTTNGGTNWILQSSGTSLWLISVYFTSSTTGWAVGGYTDQSIILKTTSGGIDPFNLNLSALIEGFYDAKPGIMNGDTINVYLRNSAPPYKIIDSTRGYLDASGHCALSFYNLANATPYYIVIKHRNSIETWSGSAVSFSSNLLTYDFTTAASQAYGNNMILKGAKYCIYSGDVNQDGTIDLSDLTFIDNDAYNFVSGYVKTDVNGDGVVDIDDATIADNNAYNFVSIQRP